MIDIRTVNVVASTKLDTTLDLDMLHRNLSQVQYEPDTFAGLIYRREKPKATIIMFSTGKIVSTGTNSEGEAKRSIEATINEIGVEEYPPICVENIVAVADLRKRIYLEGLVQKRSFLDNVIYDPEIFPALIYRHKGVTMLIFGTGKITVVGAKTEKQVAGSVKRLYRLLHKTFKKESGEMEIVHAE